MHAATLLSALMGWLFFLAPPLVVAQQTISEANQLALLEGTVVHATTKEPIRKAHVVLELSEGEHDSALVATSDETGHFRFADIKPGRYKLTVEKGGFLDGVYGGSKPRDDGFLLNVAGGEQLHDLTLLLFPGATISGLVLDADGDAVPGSEVALLTRNYRRGKVTYSGSGETTANRAGEFLFEGLLPGTYYVSANAGTWGFATKQVPVDGSGKTTRVHDLTTFYPSSLSLADAQAVHIESGQEQSGTNIRMQRGLTLSVKGRIAGTVHSPAEYSVSAAVEDGIGWTSESAKLLPNGEFEFSGLPPGKHMLTLRHQGPNGAEEVGETEVTLVDQDVTGVVITPFKPAQVRARVVMENEQDKPLTNGSVYLRSLDGAGLSNGRGAFPPQNGIYVFDNLPPGEYQPWFSNASSCYLKSLQSGGQMLNPQSIDVAEGAMLDLLLIFSKSVASLSGDVEVPDDLAKSDAHILLISQEEESSSLTKYRWPDLDQSLHFSLANLRPGKYLAFAVAEDDRELWENGEFVKLLQSQGTEVDLREKERATLHLKLTPKDETDRIRKQLGL